MSLNKNLLVVQELTWLLYDEEYRIKNIRDVGTLHSLVAWSAAAFGDGPSDIIQGALSLAGLAMQAVRGIGGLDLAVNRLIDPRGTEGNAGTVKQGRTFRPAQFGIPNGQMGRFFLAMLGGRHCGEGVLIKILIRL